MSALVNTFFWSHSRRAAFEACLRGYYYTYYGYWNGWDAHAYPQARELYQMKKLSSLPLWSGIRVHEMAYQIVPGLHTGATLTAPAARDRLTKQMREDWRISKSGQYRQDPKRKLGLREHYYGLPLEAEKVRENHEHALLCLDHLYATSTYAQVQSRPAIRILAAEKMFELELSGLRVLGKADLILEMEPGRVDIIDWKTGRTPRDCGLDQLAAYALFAAQKWPIDPEKITVRLINLVNTTEVSWFADQALLDTALMQIRESAAQMLERLADPLNNLAQVEDFPKTEQTWRCDGCNFMGACGHTFSGNNSP